MDVEQSQSVSFTVLASLSVPMLESARLQVQNLQRLRQKWQTLWIALSVGCKWMLMTDRDLINGQWKT